jgi:hypothetical protein
MALHELSTPLRQMLAGSAGIVLCVVFYLIWWCIAFKPGGSSTAFSTTCIVLAFVTGIIGLTVLIRGLCACPTTDTTIPGWKISVIGLVVYIAMVGLTYLLMKRRVTTELFLIIGFAVLELCVINALHGIDVFGPTLSVVLIVVLGIVVIGSLVCYLAYYNLGAVASYRIGMVPLIACGSYLIAIIMALLMRG